MPEVEPGAKYPRVIDPPFGLPPGWKSIERAYGATSKSAGQTYIRFDGPDGRHKTVGSIKLAVQKDAQDKGLDPDKALQELIEAQEAEKLRKAKEREETGHLKGERREQAVQAFRDKYGSLNGATVGNLPGWRGESKFLEKCGQICARYYDPQGTSFPLLKDIEAKFGKMMLDGKGDEVPDIDLARSMVVTDENGKVVNSARSENIVTDFANAGETGRGKKRKRKRSTVVNEEDYHEHDHLSVLPMEMLKVDAGKGSYLGEFKDMAGKIMSGLSQRGFADDAELVCVYAGEGSKFAGIVSLLSGLYLKSPGTFNDRPLYQKIRLGPADSVCAQLICSGLYIFWSTLRSCWKLGHFDDSKAGFAICREDKASPVGLETKWCLWERQSNDHSDELLSGS